MGSIPSAGSLLAATNDASVSLWDTTQQDVGALMQAAWAAQGANLLINPDLATVQRAGVPGFANPVVTNGAYGPDGWFKFDTGGSVVSMSCLVEGLGGAESPRPALDRVALGFTYSAGPSYLMQKVEEFKRFRGLSLSISALVKADHANMARLFLADGSILSTGAAHPGDGTWRRLAHTIGISAGATLLQAGLQLNNASGNAEATAFNLRVGSQPLDFAPRLPTQELVLCQRRFEIIGGQAGFPFLQAGKAGAGAETWEFTLPFKVQKGGIPTITKYGTWLVSNCAQPTVVVGMQLGCTVLLTASAAGYFSAVPNGTDNMLTGEWNVP